MKRKRITRVGSGAYSIYLPKKWIDSWSPEQQETREVDLQEIAGAMLIVPVLQDRAVEAQVDEQHLQDFLVSAYVRGALTIKVTPPGEPYSPQAVASARDLLRRLDERLEITARSEIVGFRLPPDLPTPLSAHDLLNLLGSKSRECFQLAVEAIRLHSHEPERALHSLRLLELTYKEDVSRLFHQTLRLVATIDLPMESVSDFQLLDLIAASLHRAAGQAHRIGRVLLAAYGLDSDALAAPQRAVNEMGLPPPPTALARDMQQVQTEALEAAATHLDGLLSACAARDGALLRDVQHAIVDAHREAQEGLFKAVVSHWGDDMEHDSKATTFTIYQASHPMLHILSDLAATAGHAAQIVAAEGA